MITVIRKELWNIRLEAFLLALYFALIPLENVLVASVGGSINKYIGILIIGIIIIKHLRSGIISVTNYLPILCFFAFSLASYLWSIGAGNSYLSILVNMTICTLVYIQVPVKQSEQKLMFYAIVFAGIILALMMLTGSQTTSINTISGGRMTLVFGDLMVDNNNLAVSLSIIAIISFHLFYLSKNVAFKMLWVIGFFVITIAIFYTGSRGGLLAEITGLSLYIWKSGKGKGIKAVLLGALAIILFSVIIRYFLSGGLAQRFSIYEIISSGGTGRIRIWGDALRSYYKDSFLRQLFGYGFGTFRKTQGMFWGHSTGSHNDFIGMLIELGLVGLVLYIIVWIKLFQITIRNHNWIALSLLTVVFVGSLSLEMLIKKMLWLAWYFVLVRIQDDDYVNDE